MSVGLLVFELTADLLAEQVALIHTIDLLIALLFLSDFILRIYLADNRKSFFKKNWFDLLASIPVTEEMFRVLRTLRILRLVRVLRAIARVRRLGTVADDIIYYSSRYVYVVVFTAIVLLSSALLFLHIEGEPNPEINTFYDSLWWVVLSSTTTGSDLVPITDLGRALGIFLMIFGVGLVGTVAGITSTYLLVPGKRKQNK